MHDEIVMDVESPPLAGESGRALPASRLERWIRHAPGGWTADDLLALVRDRGIHLVSLMHVGGDGWLKTLDFAPRSTRHLRDILSGGERADGSSLFPGLGITPGASDVVLRPRLETAFLDPFAPHLTLALLCGHAGRDGSPLPQSPDTLVRRAHARLERATGVDLHAHGEGEFFLGRPANGDDVYGAGERGYHATAPFVFGERLRRRALAELAAMGVPVKYAHAEVGYVEPGEADGVIWEQHEIELDLAPLPAAADAVVLTHWVLRNLARREGLRCSLEPIVRRGHAGNGLHFHFSAVMDGIHVPTRDADGALTEPARWLIGGLVRHGAALMAFGNRVEQSFVRLRQAKEAPNAVRWGEFDRSALVRLPVVATDREGHPVGPPTVEFRLPDGSAHPHLLLAGTAQAVSDARGVADLDRLIESTASSGAAKDEHHPAVGIPVNFAAVAAALRAASGALETGGVFPPIVVEAIARDLDARPAR